jgi:hypothetical protein
MAGLSDDDPDATLRVRSAPMGPARLIPRSQWRFTSATSIALDGCFQSFHWYELIYRSEFAPVAGAGLHIHRDRREHGGAPQRLDDDLLAEITEDERVEAGLDDYNPDEVPQATDPLPPDVPAPRPDVRQGTEYREEQAEIRREEQAGELREPSADDPFPPTRYDDEG